MIPQGTSFTGENNHLPVRNAKNREYALMNYCGLPVFLGVLQSTLVNSYQDTSDLRLIGTYLRPPFPDDQSNMIRLIRISHYSYFLFYSFPSDTNQAESTVIGEGLVELLETVIMGL